MKTNFPKTPLLLLPLLLAGCGPKTDELSALATVVVGPEYSANKGLYVPEDTRRSLGLKIVEVGEQKLVGGFSFPLRVYGVAGDRLRASGTVTPEQARSCKVGQALQLKLSGGQSVPGEIAALNTQMEKITGLIEVLVELPKTAGIETGAFVTASVVLEGTSNVATVPRSALIQTTEGNFVYTTSGEHFVRTVVKLGALSADFAEIKDGLYAGDRVVSEPAMSLWLTELAAIKGGHACCAVPAKGK